MQKKLQVQQTFQKINSITGIFTKMLLAYVHKNVTLHSNRPAHPQIYSFPS